MRENLPAFPIREKHWRTDHPDFHGMTKREYFTGLAMQAFLSNPSVVAPDPQNGWNYINCSMETLSVMAVQQADAQLAALEKPHD